MNIPNLFIMNILLFVLSQPLFGNDTVPRLPSQFLVTVDESTSYSVNLSYELEVPSQEFLVVPAVSTCRYLELKPNQWVLAELVFEYALSMKYLRGDGELSAAVLEEMFKDSPSKFCNPTWAPGPVNIRLFMFLYVGSNGQIYVYFVHLPEDVRWDQICLFLRKWCPGLEKLLEDGCDDKEWKNLENHQFDYGWYHGDSIKRITDVQKGE